MNGPSHRSVITFASDYGIDDEFVGVCKGVIAGIAPDARVLDVTHGISPQDVEEGAVVLAQSIGYFPPGVHLAVVDPGVGSGRKALVLGARDGRMFVGPDNGLLVPAAEACGGIVWARSIESKDVTLPNPSRTFHGRDIFAPAAAHLANGRDPDTFGPRLAPDSIVRVTLSAPEIKSRRVVATVQRIDRFGNLQLNARLSDLKAIGLDFGGIAEIELQQDWDDRGDERKGPRQAPSGQTFRALLGATFSSVRAGELALIEDSNGQIAIAVNGGNAAKHMLAGLRTRVAIRRAES